MLNIYNIGSTQTVPKEVLEDLAKDGYIPENDTNRNIALWRLFQNYGDFYTNPSVLPENWLDTMLNEPGVIIGLWEKNPKESDPNGDYYLCTVYGRHSTEDSIKRFKRVCSQNPPISALSFMLSDKIVLDGHIKFWIRNYM